MFWKRSSQYWHDTRPRKRLPKRRRVRPSFCILEVLGDVLDGGELHLVERAKTFEAARRRIEALAEGTPGQYVIYNGETGERLLISPPSEPSYYSGQETASADSCNKDYLVLAHMLTSFIRCNRTL